MDVTNASDVAAQLPAAKSINIRNVPHDIWLKARQNALTSGLPFRDYCLYCLMDGRLYPAAEYPPWDE